MVQIATESIVTGPVSTERLGTALLIDVGTGDCPLVVSRKQRLPRASIVVTTAAQNLIRLSKDGQKLESIVLMSSAADPTEHPEFKQISENVRDLRNKWFPKAKLCLLSSATDLESSSVRAALGIYDRPILSLEWGTTKTFSALTKRKSTLLTGMMRHLKSLERVVVQARFVKGSADNSTDNEIKGWIKRLEEVRPKEVHILAPKGTVDRKSAVRPVPKSRLEQIAAQVSEKTGIPTSIVADEPVLA